jgi:hypothetical protein
VVDGGSGHYAVTSTLVIQSRRRHEAAKRRRCRRTAKELKMRNLR